MKKTVKMIATVVMVVIAMTGYTQTDPMQDEKYGADEATRQKCIENLSVYKNPYYENGQYAEALKFWRICINICPMSSKNLYIHGEKMYDHFMDEAADDATKRMYLDSLMWLYDLRFENFGEEGYILEKKGSDWVKNTDENPEKAYEWLKKAIELEGNEIGPMGAFYYYKSLYLMLKNKQVEKSQYIQEYFPLMEIVDYNISKYTDEGNDKYIKYWESTKGNIDKYFLPIAKPEDLVNAFQADFDANPKDTILLKKIVSALEKKDSEGGTEVDLYKNAAANLCEVSPSYTCLMALGGINSKDKNYPEAYGYYKKAAEAASTPDEKIDANFKAAQVAYNLRELSAARSHCYKVIEVNPNNGEAYLLIGDCYAATKCNSDDACKSKGVYWAAVDKYIKAKSVDPSVEEKATKKINAAAGQYPSTEDCFFQTMNAGDSFTVGCWINETTTVRVRQ